MADARHRARPSARASPTCRRVSARTSIRRSRSSRTSTSSAGCSARRARSASAASPICSTAPASRPFRDRPAGKLSGGMKQKLSLCCALIHDPDLLILDEPTTGVDPLSRRQFWELIDRIRADRPGMSVLVATAYMEEAARFDWLVAMDAGARARHRHARRAPARTGTRVARGRPSSRCCRRSSARGHEPVQRPAARGATTASAAIEARRPHPALRRLRRGRPRELPHRARRDLRLPRLERLRQDDDDEDAHRPAAGERGARPGCSASAVDAADIETRRRVGYMTQTFSLYTELTCGRTCAARPAVQRAGRGDRGARRGDGAAFGLATSWTPCPTPCRSASASACSLAVAMIHGPELLILDEPTSGVDPVARDGFWRLLIDLSRRDAHDLRLHPLHERGRALRPHLADARRARAGSDAPAALIAGAARDPRRGVHRLSGGGRPAPSGDGRRRRRPSRPAAPPSADARGAARCFSLRRMLSYAQREALELRRDPVRLDASRCSAASS